MKITDLVSFMIPFLCGILLFIAERQLVLVVAWVLLVFPLVVLGFVRWRQHCVNVQTKTSRLYDEKWGAY